MHKIVNLDDERNTLEIVIGGKTWTISRIVHRVFEDYGKYVSLSGKYLQESARMSTIVHSKEASREEIEKINNEQVRQIEEYSEKKVYALFDILKTILIQNYYEYDQQWWLDNATINEIEKFIVECINKDMPEQPKKKGKRKKRTSPASAF